jgi:hypothetical protein
MFNVLRHLVRGGDEATDIMKQSGKDGLVINARDLGLSCALEAVLELGDGFAEVFAVSGCAHDGEELVDCGLGRVLGCD